MFCQGLLPDRTSRHGRGREVGKRTQLVDDECGVWERSNDQTGLAWAGPHTSYGVRHRSKLQRGHRTTAHRRSKLRRERGTHVVESCVWGVFVDYRWRHVTV